MMDSFVVKTPVPDVAFLGLGQPGGASPEDFDNKRANDVSRVPVRIYGTDQSI